MICKFEILAKGNDDIRMVYDATQCGLNEALTPPNFFMPTIDASLRSMEISTWCGDIDLGEMFLNYMLHESILQFAGIDVTECLLPPHENRYESRSEFKEGMRIWYRWLRCMMGFTQSPFSAIKACHHSE